jgi:hypothetical protein
MILTNDDDIPGVSILGVDTAIIAKIERFYHIKVIRNATSLYSLNIPVALQF